jgi:hypothetical protein
MTENSINAMLGGVMMNNLDKPMLETLRADLSDVGIEMMESGIDQFLDEGLLQNIPIVKTILSVYKAGVGFREQFFIKKILVFLNSLSDTSVEDRIKFLEKHHCEDSNLGESLIIILDRLDSMHKPKLIANLFKSYLAEEIDSVTYHRLCQIVDRCFIEDLKFLKLNEDKETVTGFGALGLANNGLAERASFDGGNFNEVDYNPQTDYRINELGKMLAKYAF